MRLFFILFLFLTRLHAAISYDVSPGRFGDQLLSYLHAKWISHHYGLPLLYKPFMHSEEFALHDLEELYSEEKEKQFDAVIEYKGDEDFSSATALYLIPFFSESPEDRLYHSDWIYFPVDWKEENFRGTLRACFAPRKKQPPVTFPEEPCLKVALHVRRGGGMDQSDAYILWPLRFPPDSYYCEALRKVSALFPGTVLYVFLFTDDLKPKEIVERYRKELADLPIRWGCREEGNGPKVHVMEDFFAMMQFDCLIRSLSNYTLIPACIGNYHVVITPKHNIWIPRRVPFQGQYIENYIDEMEIAIGK